MLNKRADKLELLRIAEAVALEKSIDKELIISSMETGIAKAAKSKFGQENEIKVSINRDSGDIELFRKLIIAENPENTNTEIKLEDAINLNETNKDKSVGESLHSLQNEDLLKFGMIPEFVGRLPVVTTLEELDLDMLIRIMQEPKNALIKQYVALFKMDGVNLEIKSEALKEIAKLAIEQKTGARGLRSILENLLTELMFETPDYKDLEKIVINKDVVKKSSDPIMIYNNKNTSQKILVNKSWFS